MNLIDYSCVASCLGIFEQVFFRYASWFRGIFKLHAFAHSRFLAAVFSTRATIRRCVPVDFYKPLGQCLDMTAKQKQVIEETMTGVTIDANSQMCICGTDKCDNSRCTGISLGKYWCVQFADLHLRDLYTYREWIHEFRRQLASSCYRTNSAKHT